MEKDEICLFSGRFDLPHCGHITTARALAQRFKKVIIVVLDHKEQMNPMAKRLEMLHKCLDNIPGENYEITRNIYHFGQIGVDRLLEFEFDVYAAGNDKVLNHIEEIIKTCPTAKDKRTLWVDRHFGVNASTERIGHLIENMK